MKALALFLFNLRSTGLRQVAIIGAVCGLAFFFVLYAGEDAEALRDPLLLAMLGILAAMVSPSALVFSPLEDLVLRGRAWRKSLPLQPGTFASASAAALLFQGLTAVLLGVAGTAVLFGSRLGKDGVLFMALFALRMALVSFVLALLAFCGRIRWGERAFLPSSLALLPYITFLGIVLSKAPKGAAILTILFRRLAEPAFGLGDGVLFGLSAGVVAAVAWIDKRSP